MNNCIKIGNTKSNGGNEMFDLQAIKEKAFDVLMYLHPKHIKVLSNEVLRPLYKRHEELELQLGWVEEDMKDLTDFCQNKLAEKDREIEALQQELATALMVSESKQKIINSLMKTKKRKGVTV
jgi:hypothetical protein